MLTVSHKQRPTQTHSGILFRARRDPAATTLCYPSATPPVSRSHVNVSHRPFFPRGVKLRAQITPVYTAARWRHTNDQLPLDWLPTSLLPQPTHPGTDNCRLIDKKQSSRIRMMYTGRKSSLQQRDLVTRRPLPLYSAPATGVWGSARVTNLWPTKGNGC